TTLIVEYDLSFGTETADSFVLTDAAKKLITENPERFRQSYGDYFVAAVERGARFIALYKFQASSREELNSFKASIGGHGPNVMSAEASSSFLQEAKKKNIQWKIDLTMDGYNGNPPASGPWDPDSVYRTLAWFRDNAVGIPVGVMLKHYSTVAPGYPPTVDV